MLPERKGRIKRGRSSVVFAVLKDDKILLQERIEKGTYLSGFTIIPGGRIEKGESIVQALERELKEECGCILRTAEYVKSYVDVEDGFEKERHLFVITGFSGDVVNCEKEKSRHVWALFEEARVICRHYSTLRYLSDIEKMLSR